MPAKIPLLLFVLVMIPCMSAAQPPRTPGLFPHEDRGIIESIPRALAGQSYIPEIRRTPLPPPPPGFVRIKPKGRYDQLVILVRFSDHKDRKLPDRKVYEAIFNARGGHKDYAPNGSVLDYIEEVSYDSLHIETKVVGWIDLPETEAYYANGKEGDPKRISEAIRFALQHIDDNELVDFRLLDRTGDRYGDVFSVIHSGYDAALRGTDATGTRFKDRIWSHQFRIQPFWTSKRNVSYSYYAMASGLRNLRGNDPCQVGLLCHEMAHLAELPDLYDNVGGHGIGLWGVLGYHHGFNESQDTPSHMTPWGKIQAGWINDTQIKDLTAPGVYEIKQIEQFPDLYRITQGFPKNEYILIENRQPTGFDRDLPKGLGGLAIWHIDENKPDNSQEGYPELEGWPENGAHYKVALIQADGRFDLEHGVSYGDASDLFRASGVDEVDSSDVSGLRPYQQSKSGPRYFHRISQISEPGRIMSFRYDVSVSNGNEAEKNGNEAENATVSTTKEMTSDNVIRRSSGSVSQKEVLPLVEGVVLADASYSHSSSRILDKGDSLLRVSFVLPTESTVHIRGSASVSCSMPITIVNGVLADGETQIRKASARLVSLKPGKITSLTTNSRMRLRAGKHTLNWVIKSDLDLDFPGGGSLVIQAFPM